MRTFRLRGIKLTPPVVISMLAIFVALSPAGIAADVVPLAKRALTANKAKVAANAQRLNGQTATQIAATPGPGTDAATLNGQTAAQIAALPGPTSSLAGSLFTVRSAPWSIQLQGEKIDSRALCASGEKALAGGWDIANGLIAPKIDRPLANGSGWFFQGFADSGDTVPANGSSWAVCAKVSS